MHHDKPLHEALAAWRAAERRLSETSAGDPNRRGVEAEVERLRAGYQARFDEIEDVAGHGAPYADEPAGEPAAGGRTPVDG